MRDHVYLLHEISYLSMIVNFVVKGVSVSKVFTNTSIPTVWLQGVIVQFTENFYTKMSVLKESILLTYSVL